MDLPASGDIFPAKEAVRMIDAVDLTPPIEVPPISPDAYPENVSDEEHRWLQSEISRLKRERHQLREYLSGRESRERLLLRFGECGKGHTACPKPFRARPTDSFSSRCLSRLLRGEASGAAESAVGKIMAHDGSLPCARPHSAIPYRKATTAVSGCRGRGPSRMRLYERLHAPDGARHHACEHDAVSFDSRHGAIRP